MKCPRDNHQLEKILFHSIGADYCPLCLGIWFDKDELRQAKDDKDEQLNWLDIDLWRDKSKFRISRGNRHCPVCRAGLQEVEYDSSKTKVDFCKMCEGIWLDRGEFKQIVNYLKNKSDYEVLNHYTKNLIKQMWEVFAGPGKLRSELADVFMLMKLFSYKFQTQHPYIKDLIKIRLVK